MGEYEAFIQLGATFIILMVILWIIYKVATKFSEDTIVLKKENARLEREDRNRESEAHINNMKRLVDVVTDWQKENNISNSEHSSEHRDIIKTIKRNKEEDSDIHKEMSKQIMTNTDSIKMVHDEIKSTHIKFESLLSK